MHAYSQRSYDRWAGEGGGEKREAVWGGGGEGARWGARRGARQGAQWGPIRGPDRGPVEPA